jgi:hypothetical protein
MDRYESRAKSKRFAPARSHSEYARRAVKWSLHAQEKSKCMRVREIWPRLKRVALSPQQQYYRTVERKLIICLLLEATVIFAMHSRCSSYALYKVRSTITATIIITIHLLWEAKLIFATSASTRLSGGHRNGDRWLRVAAMVKASSAHPNTAPRSKSLPSRQSTGKDARCTPRGVSTCVMYTMTMKTSEKNK